MSIGLNKQYKSSLPLTYGIASSHTTQSEIRLHQAIKTYY